MEDQSMEMQGVAGGRGIIGGKRMESQWFGGEMKCLARTEISGAGWRDGVNEEG